jgi:hypothetical protein
VFLEHVFFDRLIAFVAGICEKKSFPFLSPFYLNNSFFGLKKFILSNWIFLFIKFYL